MIAGQLTEFIKVYKPVIVITEFGEQETKYTYKCMVRARLQHNGGGRQYENNELVYPYTKEFTVRHYVKLSDLDHILWNDKWYKILDVTPDKQRMNLSIRCEEINE